MIQESPECEHYIRCLIISETSLATNYSIRSNLHQLTVEEKNKLALNPFDDKRMYLTSIKRLPKDKHTQKGD